MGFPRITKGSDEKVQATLLDSEGDAIVINPLYDIVVKLYQEKANIIQSFSKLLNTITVEDSAGGIISFIIDRSNTRFLPSQRLFIEIDVIETNAAYEGGKKHSLLSDIALCDLVNSTQS